MPTELEELVGFIPNPNPQIRLLATENLVAFSTTQPAIFKVDQLQPVQNLKILVLDHAEIAEHAITILVNLSADSQVLENLATDDKFVNTVVKRIANPSEPNANLLAMLLANLAKWDSLKDIMKRKQDPQKELGSDDLVINQLVDLFVRGSDGSYNKNADFDYLAYFFADLSKHAEARAYFVEPQAYDLVIPLTKLKVFTEHKSDVRRKGVASTLKNVAFDVACHPAYLAEDGINVLPYVLLPITGNEDYDEDEALAMLPDLQLLPPDKRRDPDTGVVRTHVETLTLLATTREGREAMREVMVYPIIRETHARVNDEGVQEACDRLVQLLMRDEEPEAEPRIQVVDEDDEDRIVEV